MVKLMTVADLIEIARGAGIILEPAETRAEEKLYVYATKVGGNNVYIGKSAGPSRSATELRVEAQGYKERVGVGFSALIRENDAVRHPFAYDPDSFDPEKLRRHIERFSWSGPAIDTLLERLEQRPVFSVEEVEHILVRIHVCTGRLIGNSQYASQWEGGVNDTPNVVAVLAADIAREAHGGHLSLQTALDPQEGAAKGDDDEAVA